MIEDRGWKIEDAILYPPSSILGDHDGYAVLTTDHMGGSYG